MQSTIYFPVVRGRPGEIEAIFRLSPQARARVAMVIDLPTHECGFNQTLDDYVGRFASDIGAAWGSESPIYLDLTRYSPDQKDARDRPIVEHLFDCSRQRKLRAVPVTGTLLERGPGSAYIEAVARIAEHDGRGAALRLSYPDFSDPDTLSREIDLALTHLSLSADNVDLFFDAESISLMPPFQANEDALVAILVQAIGVIRKYPFRNVVFVGSSVPETLPPTAEGGPREFVRTELRVWKALVTRRDLPLIRFADTGVWNPRQVDIGGGGGGPPPARVRLPVGDRHVYFRAENARYRDICQEAMRYPGVRDLPECWGLDSIERCGKGAGKVETASMWVARDTNTHIEVTVRLVEEHLRQHGRLQEVSLAPINSSPWRQESLVELLSDRDTGR